MANIPKILIYEFYFVNTDSKTRKKTKILQRLHKHVQLSTDMKGSRHSPSTYSPSDMFPRTFSRPDNPPPFTWCRTSPLPPPPPPPPVPIYIKRSTVNVYKMSVSGVYFEYFGLCHKYQIPNTYCSVSYIKHAIWCDFVKCVVL